MVHTRRSDCSVDTIVFQASSVMFSWKTGRTLNKTDFFVEWILRMDYPRLNRVTRLIFKYSQGAQCTTKGQQETNGVNNMSILKNKRTPVLTFPFNTRDKRPFIQI